MLPEQFFSNHFLFNSSAFALNCYVCVGTEDSCKKSKLEEDKANFLMTCLTGDRCIRHWYKGEDHVALVSSGCTYQSLCDTMKTACDKLEDARRDYHCAIGCCSEDGCNTSSHFAANTILLVVSSVLGLALLN